MVFHTFAICLCLLKKKSDDHDDGDENGNGDNEPVWFFHRKMALVVTVENKEGT